MNIINEIFNHISRLFQWWVIILPWEQGLRARFGKHIKMLGAGTHFKIPFFDAVYVQTTRLRVMSTAMQTLSTLDKQTITVTGAVGYTIESIQKIYATLHHPESTLCNIVQGEIASFVSTRKFSECSPIEIEIYIFEKLKSMDYGIRSEYFKVIGYMNVRTYRLISDPFWQNNGLDLEIKK